MPEHPRIPLPDPVIAAIERCTGSIAHAVLDEDAGVVKGTLFLTAGSRVMVKGVRVNHPHASLVQKEGRILGFIHGPATPDVQFRVDVAGWRLLGLEHTPGRIPDLGPGSPHVRAVSSALAVLLLHQLSPAPTNILPSMPFVLDRESPWHGLRALLAGSRVSQVDPFARDLVDRLVDWELDAIELCAGDALVHTRVAPGSLRMSGVGSVTVLDWGHALIGPAWTDLAVLAAQLVEHGHSPDDAMRAVAVHSKWREAAPTAITAHAVLMYGVWENRRLTSPSQAAERTAAAWRDWARYLWDTHPPRLRRV